MEKWIKRCIAACLAAVLIMSGTVSVPASGKNTGGGYTIPAVIKLKVGEEQTVKIADVPSKCVNMAIQINPTYAIQTGYSAGSYWGKATEFKLKGKKDGSFPLIVTLRVYKRPGDPSSLVATHKLYSTVVVGEGTQSKKIPLNKIALNKRSLSLIVGATQTLSVSYTPSNTTDSKAVKWKSSNTGVATVSGGKITAKKAGTATITATVGAKRATCTVTVKAPKKSTKPSATADGYVNVSECYSKLDAYRSAVGAKKLVKNATLENYAKVRAKELVKKYSHTRPDGRDAATLILNMSVCDPVAGTRRTRRAGENIAMGQKSCGEVMLAWYNSPGHRANMLQKDFTKVGIAAYRCNGTIYWVQLFST